MTDPTENTPVEGEAPRESNAAPSADAAMPGQSESATSPSYPAQATPAPADPAPAVPEPPVTTPPAATTPAPHYGHYAPTGAQSAPTAEPAAPSANHTPSSHDQWAAAPGVGAFGQPMPSPAEAHADTAGPASAPRRMAIPVIAALAVGALIGGVAGAGVTLLANGGLTRQVALVGDSTPGTITVNNAANASTVTAVAAKAGPSVVTISVDGRGGSGTGSGVVIDDEGHIVTNTHVVTLDGASGASTITVQTWDGRILEATLVGTDPLSDLAVIKVDAGDLPAIDIADSGKLNVGDVAVAIGAPLGLANTVTDGIVSALNRSITVASSAVPEETPDAPETPQSPFDFWRFDNGQGSSSSATATVQLSVLQTDASINPGNSGGALLNAKGELIGINVAIATAGSSDSSSAGSIGVGFAIPANLVKRVAGEIIDSGAASHGLLGAMVRDSQSGRLGAEIDDTTPGGPAATAGLRSGDIVTYLGEVPISSASDLTAQVRALAAGAETTVTVVRGSNTMTFEVTLGALD